MAKSAVCDYFNAIIIDVEQSQRAPLTEHTIIAFCASEHVTGQPREPPEGSYHGYLFALTPVTLGVKLDSDVAHFIPGTVPRGPGLLPALTRKFGGLPYAHHR